MSSIHDIPHTPSSFRHVIHSTYNPFTMTVYAIHSPCHPISHLVIHSLVIHSPCHYFTNSSIRHVIKSPCDQSSMSSIHHVRQSPWHHGISFTLSFFHHIIHSPGHAFKMSLINLVILPPFMRSWEKTKTKYCPCTFLYFIIPFTLSDLNKAYNKNNI